MKTIKELNDIIRKASYNKPPVKRKYMICNRYIEIEFANGEEYDGFQSEIIDYPITRKAFDKAWAELVEWGGTDGGYYQLYIHVEYTWAGNYNFRDLGICEKGEQVTVRNDFGKASDFDYNEYADL